MLKIAITGNIASGKSLFEKRLKTLGYKVLCLDEVTHFLYENSSVLKEFLLKNFNTLERKKVAAIVFNDGVRKKKLEDFIYPLILDEMNRFFAENEGEKILFVSAALLFETGLDKYFDKTVLITTDEKIRLERLMKRNSLTEKEALVRIKSQGNEDTKIQQADYVIENSLDVLTLESKAEEFITSLNTLL